jgi:hypothetical protein
VARKTKRRLAVMHGLDARQVTRERRRKKHKMCDRKEPYSRDRALFAAREYGMRPYLCEYCARWHLSAR